jgi:transcriptional regulator GlxA family with amidase domain
VKRPNDRAHVSTRENNLRTADEVLSAPEDAGRCQPVTAVRGVVKGHVVTTVRILRERLTEPWTLNLLADEVHLSRSQLVRAFDATVGVTPMAYPRLMRVQGMARLLACTDLSVAEIARSVGWTDANYASRCFHAARGMSPTESRRSR